MLIGDGELSGVQDSPAPDVVKEYYYKWWWAYFGMLLLVCAGKGGGGDLAGALNTGVIAFVVWYVTRHDCEKMSQCCVLFIGLLTSFNFMVELLNVSASLAGRETRIINCEDDPTKGSTVCTITIERHPFFDKSQGNLYNWQSIMLCVSPIAQLIGSILCHITYMEYPNSLFSDDGGAAGPVGPLGRGGGQVGGQAGAHVFYGTSQRLGSDGTPFSGEGQRLGS